MPANRLRWRLNLVSGELELRCGRAVMLRVYHSARHGWRCWIEGYGPSRLTALTARTEQAACHEAYLLWRARLTAELNRASGLLRMAVPGLMTERKVR